MEHETEPEPSDNVVWLRNPLSVNDLLNNEGATFEINFENVPEEEPQLQYNPADVLAHVNPSCCALVDEDTYQDGEPFEKLSAKMMDVLDDGGVKKRILREGYGAVVPENSVVTVDYNAYVEYNDEPYDSTYLRRKPCTFRLNEGATIPGLDVAVQSMKLNEQAQFLIEPKYAYGALGCLARVPHNSTVLFEVELNNFVDSGATVSYQSLPEEKKQEFDEVYKYSHALNLKARDLFGKGLIKQAIKEYNVAVAKLETCTLRDYADQEKQQQLLLRLLTNLVVSYTKIQEPRRACINCNKIYNMCRGTSLKVPAKVYFNHGRSLIMLSDFDWAEKKLKQAQKLEPQNAEITKEFIKLDAKKKESYNREVALAKAIFRNTEINKELHETDEVTQEFRDSISQYFTQLLQDDYMQYNLPDKLTKKELQFTEKEGAKHGLQLKHCKVNGEDKYFIAKPSKADQSY